MWHKGPLIQRESQGQKAANINKEGEVEKETLDPRKSPAKEVSSYKEGGQMEKLRWLQRMKSITEMQHQRR